MKQLTVQKWVSAIFGVSLLCLLWPASTLADTDDPQYCIGCHDDNPMYGVHAGSDYGLTNLVAECAACHGNVQDLTQHKLDGSDLIRFGWMQSPTNDQNGQCLACHEPKQLGIAHWTHDAHGDGLACSSCHALHPENDPVRGLSEKATIQLCVDCHSKQTLANEGGLE